MNEYPSRRHLMSPWLSRQVYQALNVYVPPRFAEGIPEAELLLRYVNRLGIGDLLSAAAEGRRIDEERYRTSLLMAETLEQHFRLFHTLDERIPLEEKPENEQALWRAFVEDHRPLYMHAAIGQPSVDQLSFVPVLSVRKMDKGWQFQLGHDIHKMGIPVTMRHERYWAASLHAGLRTAYKLFQRWRTQEVQALSDYMAGVGQNLLRHAAFLGYGENFNSLLPESPEIEPDAGQTAPAVTLDSLIHDVFLPDPRRHTPDLIINGMAVGVIPLRNEKEYLLVLEPVGEENTDLKFRPGREHKGVNGRDFRFLFTAPNDWMACVNALGYLDAMHPPYLWN